VVTVCAEEGGPYGHREEANHAKGGRAKDDGAEEGRVDPAPEGHRPQEGGDHPPEEHGAPEDHRAAEVDGPQEHGTPEDHREEAHDAKGGRAQDDRAEEGRVDPPAEGHRPQEGGDHPAEEHGSQDHPPEDRRSQDHHPAEEHGSQDHHPAEDRGDAEADRPSRGAGRHADHAADHAPGGSGPSAGTQPLGWRRGDPSARGVALVVGFERGGAPLLGLL
jgi:hypothetical protein